MLKAVFFDNDGVLVETEHLYFKATREVFDRKGIVLTEEMYVEYLLRRGTGAWFLLEQKGCSAQEVESLRRERNRIYTELVQSEPILIAGVEAALKRLYGKALMGIVTSSRRDHFEIIHSRTGILPYFIFCLTIEDYEKAKPDPDPYLKAIEKSGLKPDECLAVEDSERGLLAAVAAGLRCMVVPRGLTGNGRFDKAHRVKNNLAEVVEEIFKKDECGRMKD
ncbi:MAG: HAD family phosphatase [Desulfobacteraceae bacterium]|nr:MAG: HAD family phosphatase [Desulfobacteraceae bacterium]